MRRSLTYLPILALVPLTLGGAKTSGGRGAVRTHDVVWRNSLADALRDAERTGKPVLLLSMFGKLDEEMPCANARTLRATLFKDPAFAAFARTEVIPAWEMVRPVPRVTVDLGDGKRVVRTVRGNAVMYLVRPDGKAFDAFPGVYSTPEFLEAARESINANLRATDKVSAAWHLGRARVPEPTLMTFSKGAVERPVLFTMNAAPIPGARPETRLLETARPGSPRPDGTFRTAAARLADDSLNPTSPMNIRRKPAELIALDTQTNLGPVRGVVHFYFGERATGLPTPAEARDAILGTVLKIPYKDPYLGLRDVLLPGTEGD